MTTIDGDRLPGSIPGVPGATLTILEAESVRTGRTRGELVALAVDAMFSTAAAPSPAGAVDGGQGATRPPAPTVDGGGVGSGNAPGPEVDDVPPSAPVEHTPTVPYFGTVALPRPHVHLGSRTCVYGDRCGR